MANSLLTGVSGLLAHQRMLDVTGNNLANVSTTGYKAQRVMFSDIFYETLKPASRGLTGSIGGTNPVQLGSGSTTSQIHRDFSQASLESTGGVFDFAIEGDGFFVVNNGTVDLLSRSGSFGLDVEQFLVDPATGYTVRRFGTLGEATGSTPGYQVPGDPSIRIPFGATVPGSATGVIALTGNLSVESENPASASLITGVPFLTAGIAAESSTLLNDINHSLTPYVSGDSIEITIGEGNGAPTTTTLAVDATTTVGDLVDAINAELNLSTASIDNLGNIVIEADQNGSMELSVSIADAAGNTGSFNYVPTEFEIVSAGTDGARIEVPVEFFDTLGRSHVVTLEFGKTTEDHTWNVSASIPSETGTLDVEQLGQVRFGEDGSFAEIVNSTNTSIQISADIFDLDELQTIELRLASNDGFQGMTQNAGPSSVGATSDGFTSGTLHGATVSSDGTIIGTGTNGRQVPIAQLAIARVANNSGLSASGQNHFETTINSGSMQVGSATSGGRGRVLAGQLEGSNVDLAFEFTRLIIAQRGFSANARSITVADEVMEEITNIIR